jgi:RNA recognition motif-containing protein
LTALGLHAYPPLPPTTEPAKVEEIRRTVYVGNLPKGCDGEELINFFNASIGEVCILFFYKWTLLNFFVVWTFLYIFLSCCFKLFLKIFKVMYLRMAAGNEQLPCDYAYIEFSQQSSVPLALQNSDSIEFQGKTLRFFLNNC